MVTKTSKTPTFNEVSRNPFSKIEDVTPREWQFAGGGAAVVVILFLFFSLIGVFNISVGEDSPSANGGTFVLTEAQSGRIALTEAQLREEVKSILIPVYWAGPQEGALYTLENQANLRVFVRYLPDGKIPPDGEASKRIIGTYALKDAFNSTKTAGTTVAGGIGFDNDDGAAVYYNSSAPNNVYMAYPGTETQIEIFDPIQGVAVQLATARGTIQVIR
jgi:hypothetical protein